VNAAATLTVSGQKRCVRRGAQHRQVSLLKFKKSKTVHIIMINSFLADVCTLKKDSGMCRAAVTAWYFDPPTDSRNKGECKNFIYGGCGGNANRFASKKKCDDMCAYLPFGASK
jgi:hypothetical protein